MYLIWFFTLIIVKSMIVHGELFTSTTHLIQLLNTEIELAKQLETYLKEEYDRLDQVEKFLNVIKDEIQQAQGKEEIYFGNPVNSYLFIKHLTTEWYDIKQKLPSDLSKTMDDNWLFPSFEDYTGSGNGLMRLQDTYQLNTSQLANGEISTNYKSRKLTSRECYDLGRIASRNGDFYHTLLWMQEALDHFNSEINNKSMDKFDILDHLAYATSQQGNIEHALILTKEMLAIDPDHIRAKNNKIYYENIIANQTLNNQQREENSDGSDETNANLNRSSFRQQNDTKNYQVNNKRPNDYWEEFQIYERLCRQEDTQLFSPSRRSKLSCRYHHNNHPYLIIQPVKQEQLFDRPAIFLFHDVISDSDINTIKQLAEPQLQRANLWDITTDTYEPADYRVSKSAWLENDDSPVVNRLTQFIGAVTNLNMETAEDLQIANYGVGGHYGPHFDFSYEPDGDIFSSLDDGDRIATWLIYLSDVEQGGATVFPIAGARIVPKKGSAAFWYNLHPSGEGDIMTLHAACPVLIGNKWVANKWIHQRGQEFRRPRMNDPMV